MVGLEYEHKLAGWSKAGVVSNFCSVGRCSEKELKYSCCSSETRDPAAPKGEQDLWKPCHRNHIPAPGACKPNAVCSLLFRLWDFKLGGSVHSQEVTKRRKHSNAQFESYEPE